MDGRSIDLLEQGALALGSPLSSHDIRILSLYVEELQRWAQVFNLVSQWDEATLIRTHILDSIAAAPFLPHCGRLLDLGSGAGLPGLILAIVQPKRHSTLVEVRRKRANFLRHVVREAKIENVDVYERRAESLAKEAAFQRNFQIVISRATWNIPHFLQIARPFVAEDGLAVAMKGPKAPEESRKLADPIAQLGFLLRSTHLYSTSLDGGKRSVIFFAKASFT